MKDVVCNGRSLNTYILFYKDMYPDCAEDELQKAIKHWIRMAKKENPKLRVPTLKTKKDSEFVKIKPMVLDRDDYKCVICGSTDRIQVHHIKERSQGGANVANNLITLCYKCHCKKHENEDVYKLMVKSLEG